jgi:hypothetical protein
MIIFTSKTMTRFTFFILISILMSAGACSSRDQKIDRKTLIPRKDLTSIITDIYITDGLMTIPKIRYFYVPSDSLSSYKSVIERHGYKKEDMDHTIEYYYIKNPKVLINIYDQVLATLSEMETRYEKEIGIMQTHSINLWTSDMTYSLPDPVGNDSTSFDVAVKYQGIFSLSFTATIYPEDESVNPGFKAYVINSDSLSTGKKRYLKEIKYFKDGHPHDYYIQINCSDKPKHNLRGLFYDIENNPDYSGSHLIIENISYSLTSGAL